MATASKKQMNNKNWLAIRLLTTFVVATFTMSSVFASDGLSVITNIQPKHDKAAKQQNSLFLKVDAAVAKALAGNPGLQAVRSRALALSKIPVQKGTLPDPGVFISFMNLPVDSFAIGQEPMTQLQIGISQNLPYPGKLALQELVSQYEVDMAEYDVSEMQIHLVADVKAVWWNLFYLDRALEIVGSNQELLRQFVDIAQTKYKVGKGLQQDVLLAQVELSKFLDQEIQLRSMRRSVEARLNALLDYPVSNAIQIPRKVEASLPNVLDETRLIEMAYENRPLLIKQAKLLAAAHARVDLAKKNYYPDFKLGAAYGFRDGENPDGSERTDFASIMFSMNLPLYAGSRQDNKLDQRKSEVIKQQYREQDIGGQVETAIARALSSYTSTREQVALFEHGIIPQASQTVASMRAGYQVNKVDFLNLVRSQISLFNFETQYWKSLSEAMQSLARLEAAVGKETIYE